MKQTRRTFLKHSAAAGLTAAFTLAGTKASARVLGANDRIRIAVAGINSRGQEHLAAYCAMKDQVEIAYLADPDSRLFAARQKFVQEKAGNTPKCIQDLREALNDKDIDAVSIASPDHWHTLLAIWSCQAGKDVYVEKPCSHTILEGRRLIEAARKFDRIVQHGTQNRSNPAFINQMAAIRSGKYGKLLVAYGYASKPRQSIGVKAPKEPPQGLDFNLWLGPAPQQPYHENLVHYNWHWFWDFGCGEIGNQGVHQMDIARWAMPEGAAPQRVISLGGRFGYKDQGQTPNTQLTIIDFGEAKIFFEDRGLVDDRTTKVTNEFYTTGGVIKHGRFYPKGKNTSEPLPEVDAAETQKKVTLTGKRVDVPSDAPSVDPQQLHFANFIECVRSRKREDLKSEIVEGHLTSMLCHLGNISYRLGEDMSFTHSPSLLDDDAMAGEAWGSMKQHLTDVTDMNLDENTYRLGRALAYDAQAEKFINDDEANRLLSCACREPFSVPETI
ncbi:MAG TPA: Gfo/Idh/MocA family oxidoreductase [Candidatus Hydrogenedentes bacterium]|nr:Gfo/Idh/MocA family oxidoreductase [Candidatus Hydrogenedentota bacterium]